MKLIYNYFILLFFLFYISIFSQNQDTILMKTFSLDNFNNLNDAELDTSLSYFEIYDFAYKKSFSNIYLSNIGLAAKSNLYYLINNNKSFIFSNSARLYMINNSDVKYFNTKKHYTNLEFYTNLSKKNNNQVLNIIHTQNITENFNAGLCYKMITSNGEYQKQVSANNNFVFFTSYQGKIYQIFGNFIFNKIKSENNGGIDSKYVIDDVYIRTNKESIPVWLTNSKSINTNRQINIYQFLKFDFSNDSIDTICCKKERYFQISHKFNYQYDKLNYYNSDSYFYQYFFLDSTNTFDSAFNNNLRNFIYFNLVNESNKKIKNSSLYYINDIEDYYHYGNYVQYLNNGIGFFYDISDSMKNKIKIDAKYYVDGRKINNFQVYLFVSKKIINKNLIANFLFQHKNLSPEYFEEHYYSNNLYWNKDFKYKKALTDIKFSLVSKKHMIKIGFNYGIYDNLIYFKDTFPNDSLVNILPFQETHTINYISLYMYKDFNFKHFRINNKIAYQKSSNAQVLSIPQFAVFNSTAYKFILVKNVLVAELGLDFYYYSKFKADNFIPATTMFYRQNTIEIGNYPKFDAFLKLKFKRARLFAKFEHVNFGLTGTDYYASINQPINPRVFRFGVSWRFYD